MIKTPRVALLGIGRWGNNLARNLYNLDVLHTICDSDPTVLAECQRSYPGVSTATDWSDAIKDSAIDAVVIATPAITHYKLAAAALAAGKHTFVEKPLAMNETEGEDLIRLADDQKRTLMVGHLLHYHPAMIALLDIVHHKKLGDIQYLYSHRLNLGTIRRDENALWSFAPHDISVTLALLGTMPTQVSVTGGKYLQPNIDDVTVSNLMFPNGVQAHIFVSWLHPYKVQRLVVVGSEGMAVFDDTSQKEKLVIYDKSIDTINGQFFVQKSEGNVIRLPNTEPLSTECSHFVECVKTGMTPSSDGREGLRVLRVLEACQTSLQSDSAWIKLGVAPAGVIHE